jgi:hypothetical protein
MKLIPEIVGAGNDRQGSQSACSVRTAVAVALSISRNGPMRADQIPLQRMRARVTLARMMRTISKFSLWTLVLPLFVLSCATSQITNLTPSFYPRDPSGQYSVEMEIDTTQQTLIPSSISPVVVVGFDTYPMRPTKKTINRWEARVPIAANKDSIVYHFKVNYEYHRFGKPGKGSLLSQEYKLTIK